MRCIFLFIFTLTFVQFTIAQGIRINSSDRATKLSFFEEFPSGKFTDYFEPDSLIELFDTRPYVLNKVKRIEVHKTDGGLVFFAEIDKNGHIKTVGKKCRSQYFMVSDSIKFSNTERRVVNQYFGDKKLIRVDTISLKSISIKRDDSLIKYDFASCKSYKSGRLIIEQNHYYNERYYNKSVFMKRPRLEIGIGELSQKEEEAKIYLDKKLSTFFQPDSMYAVSFKTSIIGVQLFIDTVMQSLRSEDAKIITQNFGKDTILYFVEGENFDEPINWNTPYYCGNAFQNHYRVDYNYRYKKNGLFDNYYSNNLINIDGKTINSYGHILYRFYYKYF